MMKRLIWVVALMSTAAFADAPPASIAPFGNAPPTFTPPPLPQVPAPLTAAQMSPPCIWAPGKRVCIYTVSALPVCSDKTDHMIAFVVDAKPPGWFSDGLSGGGSFVRLVTCRGGAWAYGG